MSADNERTARLEARLGSEALAMIERAAEIQGRSVGDFVVVAALEAALRTIAETQIIRLSLEDQRIFADAVLDPPTPAPGLLRAADAYRRLVEAPK
ncbi:hypothetical protein A1351_07365 [Methylosinus sp. R-45379]|uniref:type II toxin-antitoxin system TacA family antitoxin n=1 Tax=unclassified Methylosinus TaxID=2624500 RepID=UPI0004671B85|nr:MULTISPECIES: DUF1778 domain-containing protein [unclassified Methylosinus]OAI30645.1 hypothetical protein A1351_07365 [Methylosinus sp. R-45379]TDX67190.1 uncharacterized protein (DUF1778 family) [Methylosinus sp. sav-2]